MHTQADYDTRKQRAKSTSIESYLAAKGFYSYRTVKTKNRTDYRHNPIDGTETKGTPNFSIYHNKGGEIFKDHKSGATGDIINLAEILNNCNYKEAIAYILGTDFSAITSVAPKHSSDSKGKPVTNHLKFLYEMPIKSKYIENYITNDRHLNIDIARKYIKVVNYLYYEKRRFSIGWQNDSGGYMTRYASKDVKKPYMLIGKENVTTLKKDFLATKEVIVFESMLDFLSLETALLRAEKPLNTVVIVLNSVSNVSKLDLSNFDKIYLALDNDNGGYNAVNYIREKYNKKYISDISKLYNRFKDVSEALINGKLNI